MALQIIWSFVLASLDAYALVKKKVLLNPVLISLFVVGDWVSLLSKSILFLTNLFEAIRHVDYDAYRFNKCLF
jgi:hypothetical protein